MATTKPKLLLKKGEIVAFTTLLQNPAISAACPSNCGCNEACGCKKDHCCESKCTCDQKAKRGFSPEELIRRPEFLEGLNSLDPSRVKTIRDFQQLVAELQSKLP